MRKETNSITHLVKIVAKEVFEEMWKEKNTYEVDLREMENRFCESISKNIEQSGKPWLEEEDKILIQEVRTAVAQIALNHKRSRGAISSRIRQKELIVAS